MHIVNLLGEPQMSVIQKPDYFTGFSGFGRGVRLRKRELTFEADRALTRAFRVWSCTRKRWRGCCFSRENKGFMHKKENGLDLRATHKCHIHRKQMELILVVR